MLQQRKDEDLNELAIRVSGSIWGATEDFNGKLFTDAKCSVGAGGGEVEFQHI